MSRVTRALAGALGSAWASARREPDRWLLGGAALLLAASFLGPGIRVEQALFEHVVVLDVTQSMNVQDQELAGRPTKAQLVTSDGQSHGVT